MNESENFLHISFCWITTYTTIRHSYLTHSESNSNLSHNLNCNISSNITLYMRKCIPLFNSVKSVCRYGVITIFIRQNLKLLNLKYKETKSCHIFYSLFYIWIRTIFIAKFGIIIRIPQTSNLNVIQEIV